MRTALYTIALSLYDLAHKGEENKSDIGGGFVFLFFIFFIMDCVALSKGL